MLGDASSGKIDTFINDDAKSVPPATLAQYGLRDPSIRLSLTLNGGKSTDLLVGKKDGALDYYAEDTGRSMIFSVPNDFVTSLNKQNLADLRSKVLYTGLDTDVTKVNVKTAAADTVCMRQANGGLVLEQKPGQSGQPPDCPDFLGPLQRAEAQKVEDQAPGDVRARLDKPAITVTLTTQSAPANPENPVSVGTPAGQASAPAKTMQIQISAPIGNSVYARASTGPAVYQFDKSAFDDLKPASAASASASSTLAPK